MLTVTARRVVRADPGSLELGRWYLIQSQRDCIERLTDAATEAEIARLRQELAVWDAEIASIDATIAERASA